MTQFLAENWSWLAGALIVLIVLIVFARTRRGQRVEIAPPAAPTPTLQRNSTMVHPVPAQSLAGPAGDDLLQLKGVGPKLAATLNGLGISRLDQIANWTDAEASAVDAQLGAFQGRIERDRWIEQAKFLTRGDRGGFERAFGKMPGDA